MARKIKISLKSVAGFSGYVPLEKLKLSIFFWNLSDGIYLTGQIKSPSLEFANNSNERTSRYVITNLLNWISGFCARVIFTVIFLVMISVRTVTLMTCDKDEGIH